MNKSLLVIILLKERLKNLKIEYESLLSLNDSNSGPHIKPDSRHNNHQEFTKTFDFGQSFSSSSVRFQG